MKLKWAGPMPVMGMMIGLESWRAQDFKASYVVMHDIGLDEWACSVKVGQTPAFIFPELVHSLEEGKALCETKRASK